MLDFLINLFKHGFEFGHMAQVLVEDTLFDSGILKERLVLGIWVAGVNHYGL